MDIRQIISFLEVARTKSFTRTSENLFLTQPTVSNHIKNIENELGVHLFIRSNKEISLTKAGKIFQGYAHRIINEYEDMNSEIRRFSKKREGHISIYASSVPRHHLLPQLLSSFFKKHPKTDFTLRACDSREAVDALLLGEADFSFTGAKYEDHRLKFIPIYSDKLVLISQEKPKNNSFWTIDELSKMPLIFREEGSGTRRALDEVFHQNNLKHDNLQVVAYIEDTTTILEMVKKGLGSSIVSSLEADKSSDFYSYPIEHIKEKREFYLVTHIDKKKTKLNQLFINFVINEFPY